MITDRALINRRTAIGGALAALSPLVFPGRVLAQGKAVPNDSFVLLLKGLYQPVVHGPDLGLSTVDLSDGSYSTTTIYPVNGIPGNENENKAVGSFYVQFTGDKMASGRPEPRGVRELRQHFNGTRTTSRVSTEAQRG
jgi:hypothetical protein